MELPVDRHTESKEGSEGKHLGEHNHFAQSKLIQLIINLKAAHLWGQLAVQFLIMDVVALCAHSPGYVGSPTRAPAAQSPYGYAWAVVMTNNVVISD